MTVLIDDNSNEPGTHAIVIGVGDYPCLKGGSNPNPFAHHMNMGQLSSPVKSVEQMTEWIRHQMDNNEKPLRSLGVLCSAPDPLQMTQENGNVVNIERASLANVENAIVAWKNRADRHEGNIAMFYFCGHGLSFSDSEMSLLMEDFGSNEHSPMRHAVDLDKLKIGLGQHCKALNQIFFIDACRNTPTPDFLDQYGNSSSGEQIIAGGVARNTRDKIRAVFYATSLGAAAYGQKGRSSLFTQGLLRAFKGSASRGVGNGWEIVIEAIAEAVNKCVQSLSYEGALQYCQSREANKPLTLHRLQGKPEVVVKVVTNDRTLLPEAVFQYESLPLPPALTETRSQPVQAPWWLHLPEGLYAFAAVSQSTQQSIGRFERHIAPPGQEVAI
ncbi:caspase family protein [Luteimonas sp. MC1825]|uniref:caspase family protein n=1 Tax=Luteimonas sp. MC1825 TaxID=2761107 RepID=UPI00162104FC|nr:caspase family protein [Luteimonas sp. MC1825]MBB6600332.1 caspase family protein [Luteimonas sp. MC1825]QOC88010.1 caspase family protein [Luteimonas sp. MC1825]